MGFLSLLRDIGDFAVEKLSDAADWVRDRVEDFKNFWDLGDRDSYSGSVQETVNIDQVLNRFRLSISSEAEELERKFLNSILSKFDAYIEHEGRDYPELVIDLKNKKRSVESELTGIIANHIHKRASTNDPEFRRILEMQPGASKTQMLKNQSQKFLSEAEELFQKKLKVEMEKLDAELSGRFNEALENQEEQLKKKETAYRILLNDAERGQLDLNALKDDCILVTDAASCMDIVFGQAEGKK